MEDRRRTDIKKGKKVNFEFLAGKREIPLEKITSVSVIPFTKTGRIVCIDMARGIDIPGGHMQCGENDVFTTATRECSEEALVSFDKLYLIGFIKSDFYGKDEDKLTYIAVTTGIATKLDTFHPTDEAKARFELSIEDFLDAYTAADPSLMETMIYEAAKILKSQDETFKLCPKVNSCFNQHLR